jgi:hypothetical protein
MGERVVSFDDLKVGKSYKITLLDRKTGEIETSYLGIPLKDMFGFITKKQTDYSGNEIVIFVSEEINRLINQMEEGTYTSYFDDTIFKDPSRLTTAANVNSLSRQKGLAPDTALNIASFLNPTFSKSSPENVKAETKFGHTQVPPGHYTKTAVDQAFSAGKRRKTKGRKKSKKTRKVRSRHH